jgi:hypothetical protein
VKNAALAGNPNPFGCGGQKKHENEDDLPIVDKLNKEINAALPIPR